MIQTYLTKVSSVGVGLFHSFFPPQKLRKPFLPNPKPHSHQHGFAPVLDWLGDWFGDKIKSGLQLICQSPSPSNPREAVVVLLECIITSPILIRLLLLVYKNGYYTIDFYKYKEKYKHFVTFVGGVG